jgi:RimJ/RimL family protein N-acetyltransferase
LPGIQRGAMFSINLNRLYLRELKLSDLEALAAILSDSETMQYYPAPYNHNQAENWINNSIVSYNINGFGLWAVVLKASNEFIGQCGISLQDINGARFPEIGYHISKHHWRNGYATEAAKGCLEYGFQKLGMNEIYIHTSVNNLPSYKVAEKLLMTKRFEYDKYIKSHNLFMKHVVYSMNLSEFQSFPPKVM